MSLTKVLEDIHIRILGPNSIALIDNSGKDRFVYIASVGRSHASGRPSIDVRKYTDWPQGGVGQVLPCNEVLVAAISALLKDRMKEIESILPESSVTYHDKE